MYGVDLYGRVRLAVLGQGISQREAARRFGIDRGNGFEDVGAFGAAWLSPERGAAASCA